MTSAVSKKRALLISINVLWIVLTSLPRLDGHLPAVLSLPLSEILALLLCMVLVVCAHTLLSMILGARGKPIDFGTNLAFLILSSLLMTGVGIHVSAVVILSQISSEDTLYPLVQEHMHRLWSHNMFQVGYYGLLLLMVGSEVRGYKQLPGAASGENEGPDCSATQTTNESTLLDRVVEWGCSLVMGVFYSKFAVLTVTVPLTVCVFVTVLTALTVCMVRVQHCGGPRLIWHTSGSDLYILGMLAKSCLIGMTVLPLHV